MKIVSTVKTEMIWYSAIQYAPDQDCPVLVVMLCDEGYAVGLAQICGADGCWRAMDDNSRLDPDDIEMWAEVPLPRFHT